MNLIPFSTVTLPMPQSCWAVVDAEIQCETQTSNGVVFAVDNDARTLPLPLCERHTYGMAEMLTADADIDPATIWPEGHGA